MNYVDYLDLGIESEYELLLLDLFCTVSLALGFFWVNIREMITNLN